MSSTDKKPPSPKEKMAAELLQGHNFATQLKDLIQNPNFDGVLAGEFVVKIMATFNQSLSILTCDHHQLNQACNSSPSVDDRRSEDSGNSRKRPAANSKDRRGCYTRKKNSETWSKIAAKIDDGHGWRKYGQKIILNAKYPRNYFRCTRKYDQGCKATKQVQIMEDDSQMYHITYIGAHTCKHVIKAPPQIIVPSPSPSSHNTTTNNSWVISFPPPQLEQSLNVKQELNNFKAETTQTSDITDDINEFDINPMMWKDVMMSFEATDHRKMGSDYGDSSTSASFLYEDFSFIDDPELLLNKL